jgi:hypothetical protein
LNVTRKVFVPSNDQFARWLNIVKNNGTAAQQVTLVTFSNLGSDSNTKIVTTSSGNNVAELSDTWVTTFQNWSGTISSDPRLGHILQGSGSVVAPLAGIHFTDGSDKVYWGYTFTLQPGQTGIIMDFVTGQPTKAAAASKAAQLVGLPANALQFMTQAEKDAVLNFRVGAPPPTLTPTSTPTPTVAPVARAAPAEVPEADTLILMGSGIAEMAGLIWYKSRRRK